MQISFLFAILLLTITVVSMEAPWLPKYYYIGSGVNILYLNPIDNGVTQNSNRKQILELNITSSTTTPDGKWRIPANVEVFEYDQCAMSQQVLEINSAFYYQKEVNNGFSLSGGYAKVFGASLSAGMTKTAITTGRYSSYIYDCHSTCDAYNMELLYSTKAFASGFTAQLIALPTTFDSKNRTTVAQYNKFIGDYGTHMAIGILMGGRLVQRMETSVSQYAHLVGTDVNIKAEAKATFANGITVGAGGSHGTNSSKYNEFQKYSQRASIEVFGGDPSYLNNFPLWAPSVKEMPSPQSYRLEPLDEVIRPANFPSDPHSALRQKALREALQYYTETNGYIPGLMPAFETCMSINNQQNKKKNFCEVRCEPGWYAIGGGGYSPGAYWRLIESVPILRNNKPVGWRYEMGEDRGSNNFYQSVGAYAICAKQSINATFDSTGVFVDVEVQQCHAGQSKLDNGCTTPSCSAGYHLVSGGCRTNDISSQWPWSIVESKPLDMGNGKKSWYCYAAEDWGASNFNKYVMGYAICAKWNSTLKYSQFPKQPTIVEHSTASNGGVRQISVTANCPSNTVLTGGGCAATNAGEKNRAWMIQNSYPVGSDTAVGWNCSFKEDYGTSNFNKGGTAYALCTQLF